MQLHDIQSETGVLYKQRLGGPKPSHPIFISPSAEMQSKHWSVGLTAVEFLHLKK